MLPGLRCGSWWPTRAVPAGFLASLCSASPAAACSSTPTSGRSGRWQSGPVHGRAAGFPARALRSGVPGCRAGRRLPRSPGVTARRRAPHVGGGRLERLACLQRSPELLEPRFSGAERACPRLRGTLQVVAAAFVDDVVRRASRPVQGRAANVRPSRSRFRPAEDPGRSPRVWGWGVFSVFWPLPAHRSVRPIARAAGVSADRKARAPYGVARLPPFCFHGWARQLGRAGSLDQSDGVWMLVKPVD